MSLPNEFFHKNFAVSFLGRVRFPVLFYNLSEKYDLLKILCFTLEVGGIPRIAKG